MPKKTTSKPKTSEKKPPAWQQLHMPQRLVDALWQIARRRETQTTWQQIAREALIEKIQREKGETK